MISYKPLFHTLVERNVNLSELTKAGISTRIVSKFRKNEHVNTSTIDKICNYLNCRIEDVIEHVKDK